MTEHSKIPLVPEGETGDAGSLIERAVKAFDLRNLAPPPVPGNLAPATGSAAARKADGAPAALPEGLASSVFAKPAELPVPPEVEAPTPVEVAVQAADPAPEVQAPQVVFPARDQRRKPAAFAGVYHAVDRQHLREQGMIVPEGSVTALLEEFRIVKRHILLQAAELRRLEGDAGGTGNAAQRVLVCSPLPGEGKTYCSVNLALSIAAEKESEVLLVDADFAKPSVLSVLGLPGGPGLMDALADPSADVADFVMGTDIPGLWVLPAGNATNSDSEFLSTSRTAAVLDRLTEGAPHRMVIFDSPPALAASPAAELAKYVGQALLVARADRTGQGALQDAITLLSACPNIELLLNAASFSPSGRRFGSYYGYGG